MGSNASFAFEQNASEVATALSALDQPSFLQTIFEGSPNFELLKGQYYSPLEDREIGDAYCARIQEEVLVYVDPAKIEREDKIPRSVLDKLVHIGAFGLKIPKEYGGVGLSQTNYNRVLTLVAKHCNILSLFISVQNSIGVARPILLFGSEEQKQTWLPKIAKGLISAFALTEPGVGSDPASMQTSAILSADKCNYIINGEKLWITNGTIADVIVLLAKVEGKITAFIVDMKSPGITIAARNEFMGCRGIENAWLKFHGVRVPKENVIGEVGKGLKIALTTLNVGRISIAAICLGMAESLHEPTLSWALKRETFGKPIGDYELNTHKIARMGEDEFFSRILSDALARLVDWNGHDLPVESAVAKLFCSEALWRTCETTMDIRGGRAYEKADSLRRHGEDPVPAEQIMRDARMYLIGEGASNILRMFIAFQGLARPHQKRTEAYFDATGLAKAWGGLRLSFTYARWYSKQWFMGPSHSPDPEEVYVRRTSKRLARAIFYAMLRYGRSLEDHQALLARFVDISIELFLIALASPPTRHGAAHINTARLAIDSAKARIEEGFHAIEKNNDENKTLLGQIFLRQSAN